MPSVRIRVTALQQAVLDLHLDSQIGNGVVTAVMPDGYNDACWLTIAPSTSITTGTP